MSSLPSRRVSSRRLLTALLGLVLSASSATAEMIYHETFSGPADVPLAGRPAGLRSGTSGGSADAIWIGPDHRKGSRLFADGTMIMPSVDFEGASGFLPFVPTPGLTYKLTLSGVSVRSGDWVGAGFSIATPPSGDKRFRDNKPAFWSLIRRPGPPADLTDQTFSGPDIIGPANTSALSSSSLTILIDTRSSERWPVKWFYDGRLVREGDFAPPPITHVGFGFNTTAKIPAGESTISFFALEALDTGADTDTDGLPDTWEFARFRTSVTEPEAAIVSREAGSGDPDSDGFSNLEEYVAGSDPTNPRSIPLDIDADGLADAWEIHFFGSIHSLSAHPAADPDRDGFSNLQELSGRSHPLDPASMPDRAAGAAARAEVTLEVARNGNDVFLAWTLPPGAPRQIEIYRNDRETAEGRTHLATVSAPTKVLLDQVPSDSASYWYWLILIDADGVRASHGPYTTKPAVVWQP